MTRCAYWGSDIEPEHRASWWYGWGHCEAEATVFINGKGYCEKHGVAKHTKPHHKDTRAKRAPIIPDVEDSFIEKQVDRW